MSAIRSHSSERGWVFWLISLVAVVSLLANVYQISSNTSEPRSASTTNAVVSLPDEHSAQSDSYSELQSQLRNLSKGVARNSDQLELLISELGPDRVQQKLAEKAKFKEQAKLRSDARVQYEQERQMLHLPENERAIALHERWVAENGEQLRLTDAEIDRVERSGQEELERIKALKGAN